jgi:hypothetical protein
MNRCADALKEYAKKLPDSIPKQARRCQLWRFSAPGNCLSRFDRACWLLRRTLMSPEVQSEFLYQTAYLAPA